MRIVVVQDYLRSGGTERQAVSLCREFQDAGANAMLLTFRPGGRLATFAGDLAVEHRSLTKIDLLADFLAPGLVKALKNERPDVVLCMGENANSYAGYINARCPNTVVAGTLRRGKPEVPRLNLWSFARLPAVIANTQWWRSRLIDLGLDAGRVHVIPNGLARRWDFSQYEAARDGIRRKLAASTSDVVLLNAAGFRNGKRHERLIRAVSRLPDSLGWRLWLLGDGPRLDASRQLVRVLGLRDRVHFVGHVNDPFTYYAGADIAVSMSARDALPNFIVEAQSLSLPTVASSYRGVAEALEDGVTGYLVPMENDDLFIDRVSSLISDPARRQQMGQQASDRAARLFNPGFQARRYLEIFDPLVALRSHTNSS
jgi:glycosyltransferase involved in cell wall biosynthesis